MKKFLLKYSALLLLVHMPFVFGISEKEQLKEVIQKAEQFAQISANRVSDFFSTKDKRSFAVHVEQIAHDLNRLEQELLSSFDDMIRNASTERYGIIVKKIQGLMLEVQSSLQVLYATLKQNQDKKLIQVVAALKQMQAKLKPRIDGLNSKIQELSMLTMAYDPELSQHIEGFRMRLQQALAAKTSDIELFMGLRHRISC